MEAARVRAAYIGGLGRSGSTLLTRALDRVPGLVSVGEVSNVWRQGVLNNAVCGCGRPFDACPFWSQVGEVAFGGWDESAAREYETLRRTVERVRYLPRLMSPARSGRFSEAVARYQALGTTLYRAILTVSDQQIVVDNSKSPSRAALLAAAPGVELAVVHLVRSSYGVCHSWSKHVVRGDTQQAMMRNSIPRSALRWSVMNVSFDMIAASGVPSRRMRYEDFVARPRDELAGLLAFLGVPSGDQALDFVHDRSLDLGTDHSVWGNPMRVRVGREALTADDGWRDALAPRDRRVIAALTAPGMLRYGYSIDGAPRRARP